MPDGPVTLFAFLVRKPGMTHEEFLDYWRNTHGPLIRDSPDLTKHLLAYEQHARIPGLRGGTPDFDGVAVQRYPSYAAFAAMLAEPSAQLMMADEANFLDREQLQVVFSEDAVVVVGGG